MQVTQPHDKDHFITSGRYTYWTLVKLYWQSEKKVMAWVFVATVLVMTIAMVGMDLIFNHWYNYFYNALQEYNKDETIRLLCYFFLLAFIYIIMAVYRYYISQVFALRWRTWLTDQCIGRWMRHRSYYLLEHFDAKTDNPDQRIQEDAGAIVTYSIDLVTGLVSAVTTFIAFIWVLWKLSGAVSIPIGHWGTLYIPGYLVWVGVIYAVLGTYFTVKIGNPLVNLNFEQQRREATFRFAAVDVRQHAENIALYKGEEQQKGLLHRLFDRVLENWYQIILRQKLLLWFTAGYNQLSVVLPLIVALPNYFGRVFKLGGLIQSLNAFGKVEGSLSFIVNAYTRIAEWQAIARRLITFLNHMADAEERAKEACKIEFIKKSGDTIIAKGINVSTPQSKLLLKDVNEEFDFGKNYLIKGESGLGKSTFLRTLAGIWPYAGGEIEMPEKQSVMFVPQKPYMPIGTLAEAMLFPEKATEEKTKDLEQLLRDCRLPQLIPYLHESATWSEKLSPGEQQRIGFARVLLQKPDWLFLDESTSALDMNNEEYFYNLIQERLPNCSIISVGHRPSLEAHHDHVIDMAEYAV